MPNAFEIPEDVAGEVIRDLLRSAWVIEKARASVYEQWSSTDAAYQASGIRATERSELVRAALEERGHRTDPAVVAPHAAWMHSLAGETPDEVALGNFFASRVGDWVDGHCADFLGGRAARLKELGDEERSSLAFPTELPSAPPFESVRPVEVDPPGDVLFTFGILADLHFGSGLGEETARAAISDLNRSGAELVIQLGDITDHGQKEEYDLAMTALAKLEMPFTTMMGNHDVYSIAEERLSGREYYSGSFGREPDGVIVEHKGFRFAVLDSVMHAASPYPAYNLATGAFLEGSSGAIVRGALSVAQHEILAEVAAPNTPPAFVFLHHPPQPFTGFPPILFGLRDEDAGRLHATVDSGNVWGVFAGHTHRNARTREYGTVPAHEVAMPRDFPFGYGLVDVTSDGYRYRFVQLSDEGLLRRAYQDAGEIHRRYGLGTEEERGFIWRRPQSS
ncbi:MAG: 3,5-cyclic-AMP phosphodiesterase [Actinomycetota bacterium]|nr:3,5-cyclic-AMP phosphodiesterase [Actinomycetota bacterium]